MCSHPALTPHVGDCTIAESKHRTCFLNTWEGEVWWKGVRGWRWVITLVMKKSKTCNYTVWKKAVVYVHTVGFAGMRTISEAKVLHWIVTIHGLRLVIFYICLIVNCLNLLFFVCSVIHLFALCSTVKKLLKTHKWTTPCHWVLCCLVLNIHIPTCCHKYTTCVLIHN